GKDLSETSLTLENGQLKGPIGAADKLDLTWQGPPPVGVGPLQTARARVTVRVEDDWMHTDAELVLHAQGGPVKSWVVVVPPGADLTPRELTEDERRADPKLSAAYEFGVAPATGPWLEVEPALAHAAVKTQAGYVLALGHTGPGGALEWQATTTLTLTPPMGA